MSDFAEWRSDHTPSLQKVAVCFDGALQAELEQAEDSLRDIEREKGDMLGSGKDELTKRVEELTKAVKAKTHVHSFKGLGRREWNNLMGKHPPTAEQREEAKRAGGTVQFNADTFPVVAMVKTAVDPALTEDDAQWLCDELSDGDFLKVWDAVLRANVSAGRNPFDPVSATQNVSRVKSKPRSDSASRTQSS
jgi:hypothetical protein